MQNFIAVFLLLVILMAVGLGSCAAVPAVMSAGGAAFSEKRRLDIERRLDVLESCIKNIQQCDLLLEEKPRGPAR